jgi:hypothetical protein
LGQHLHFRTSLHLYLFKANTCFGSTPSTSRSSAALLFYNNVRLFRMRCPKCQFDHQLQTTECLKCGIVFSRYQPSSALDEPSQLAAPAESPEQFESDPPISRVDAIREFKYRIFALPLALLVARLVAATGLRLISAILAMVLHESGHAITAWLTGRWAVPMLWVTPHGEERSWAIVALVTLAILFAGFLAWNAERWGLVAAAAALLLLQLIVLSLPAGALVIFFGDGGALVLGTLLMALFYVPRDSAIYQKWGLRWGLLSIGALGFMHVFLLWKGPLEDIPFGEIEGVNLSDPSLLTELYGWPVLLMVDRYVRLGTICLVFLLALYIYGLLSTWLQIKSAQPATQQTLSTTH